MSASIISSKKRKLPASEATPKKSKKSKTMKIDEPEASTSSAVKPPKKSTDSALKAKKRQDKEESDFRTVQASLTLSIPPVFADNPRQGVEELLDSLVMRYIPALSGVMLAHSNTMLSSTANIQGDCPFLICKVQFDATVWAPLIGMKLFGRISLHAPDHVSLLVNRTFNVSIPKRHIPLDDWVYSYGAAENDPEFQPAEGTENEDDDGHRWTHSITGDVLGGKDQVLEFTVVGLMVANEMLSLLGSIQMDPFAPEHDIDQPQEEKIQPYDEESERKSDTESESETEEEENDEEDDSFQKMNKIAQKAAAAEKKATEEKAAAEARAAEEAAAKSKAKAKKRKAGKELDGGKVKKTKSKK